MAATGLAFLAGILSILSPCVLPILPIVIGAAVAKHKFGPQALAVGLSLSFVVVGLLLATVGIALGVDTDAFRTAAAVVLILVGGVLLAPRIQDRFALAAGSLSNWTESWYGGISTEGLGGQFALGVLLGAIWIPCVGPTLGAASLLAAQGKSLGQVALTMVIFGLGAALPLMLLGLVSREAFARWRGRLLSAGSAGKAVMGAVLVVTGLLIVTGYDKTIETILVEASPEWLTRFTTHF
jgi:cytochrome c-type biogenesis protein